MTYTAIDAWRELTEDSDRTVPKEYWDMALITFEELRMFMAAANPSGCSCGEVLGEDPQCPVHTPPISRDEKRGKVSEKQWPECGCHVDLFDAPNEKPDDCVLSYGAPGDCIHGHTPCGRERYRHLKRGTVYEVIGTAEMQMSADVVDGSELIIYRGDDGRLWAREAGEFHDGRFERLPEPPTTKGQGE